jgi:hypothetical protein
MPDITMCHGEGCKRKLDCYRYRAIPTEQRQAYFGGSPFNPDGSCTEFLVLRVKDLLRPEIGGRVTRCPNCGSNDPKTTASNCFNAWHRGEIVHYDGPQRCAALLDDPPSQLAIAWEFVSCPACLSLRVSPYLEEAAHKALLVKRPLPVDAAVYLTDAELAGWLKLIERTYFHGTYLAAILAELRERRDAEAFFIDADLQLQAIGECGGCDAGEHPPNHPHREVIARWRLAQGALCAMARIHRGFQDALRKEPPP